MEEEAVPNNEILDENVRNRIPRMRLHFLVNHPNENEEPMAGQNALVQFDEEMVNVVNGLETGDQGDSGISESSDLISFFSNMSSAGLSNVQATDEASLSGGFDNFNLLPEPQQESDLEDAATEPNQAELRTSFSEQPSTSGISGGTKKSSKAIVFDWMNRMSDSNADFESDHDLSYTFEWISESSSSSNFDDSDVPVVLQWENKPKDCKTERSPMKLKSSRDKTEQENCFKDEPLLTDEEMSFLEQDPKNQTNEKPSTSGVFGETKESSASAVFGSSARRIFDSDDDESDDNDRKRC